MRVTVLFGCSMSTAFKTLRCDEWKVSLMPASSPSVQSMGGNENGSLHKNIRPQIQRNPNSEDLGPQNHIDSAFAIQSREQDVVRFCGVSDSGSIILSVAAFTSTR